jgi:predicted ribosome quality control (RQC) complex YloA/Tae2 family protein
VDNLVLTRVAADLDRSLRGAFLRDLRQETRHRFRLRFELGEKRASVLLSLRPEIPWIGRPALRREKTASRSSTPLARRITRALGGSPLADLVKPTVDRVVVLRFGGSGSLVLELATHGANLVLLDGEGRTVATARSPKSGRVRLEPGTLYAPPELPRGKFDPFAAGAGEIDRFLAEMARKEESAFEALRRHAFGIGSAGAEMIVREAGAESVGAVAGRRLDAVLDAEADPVIEAVDDPLVLAEEGRFEPDTCRLLPWEPPERPRGEFRRIRRGDAAATAGLYHEAMERALWIGERVRGLRSMLEREAARLERVRLEVERDIAAFTEPDRYRIWGEAILAGMGDARRTGDTVMVADPYDAGGKWMEIPAPADKSLPAVAEEHFVRHRRAVRGLEAARKRSQTVLRKRDALETVLRRAGTERCSLDRLRDLEERMRLHGIPVGLEVHGRARRAPSGGAKPRLEGVRMVRGSEETILVGKGGRHNDRLTFRLASPEDFWFHAMGVPGAHVVVRNPDRRPRPSRTVLEEAAAVAAWYSDAREQAGVEVQWTRRKYVRRIRGAAPGKVILKRFETIRVRPGLPPSADPGEI